MDNNEIDIMQISEDADKLAHTILLLKETMVLYLENNSNYHQDYGQSLSIGLRNIFKLIHTDAERHAEQVHQLCGQLRTLR